LFSYFAKNYKMTLFENLLIDKKSLLKRLGIGALFGFGFISLFVFGVDDVDPEWGKYWQVRPLIVTPLFGAIGSLAFYLRDIFPTKSVLAGTLILVASVIVFIMTIWVGIVVGLDGTMWD
jgi:hypothetical protein